MSAPEHVWLSRLQAAAHAGVSVSTIHNWMREGRLKYVHPAGTRRTLTRDDWLEACILGRPPPADDHDKPS